MTGWCEGVADPPSITLSPRGARAAAELAGRYPGVRVGADNQEVADRSDLVVLAVRPQDPRAGPSTGCGSGTAGRAQRHGRRHGRRGARSARHHRARRAGHPAARRARAPLSRRDLPGATRPWTPSSTGSAGRRPSRTRATLDVFQTLTSTLTTHYWYLATLTAWAARQGSRRGRGPVRPRPLPGGRPHPGGRLAAPAAARGRPRDAEGHERADPHDLVRPAGREP